MSNISDILLSIRALAPEDLRAFAETSKKCIEEDTRRRLDAIPPIPEEDEAREIPVTQTYPFIYISNEDLKKATYKMASNANGQPDSVQFTQEIDNPVIANQTSEKTSFLCVKKYPRGTNYSDIIDSGVNHQREVGDHTPFQINDTHRDENVVFIMTLVKNISNGWPSGGSFLKSNLVVISNFGNIHFKTSIHDNAGGGNQQHVSKRYPEFTDGLKRVNAREIQIVPTDFSFDMIDEFCRVPQLFVDLMCFTLRSFGEAYNTEERGQLKVDEDFFKALCRKYNKDRRDMQTRIQTLETSLETLKEEMVRKNDLIEKQHIEEMDTDRINTFESLKEEHVIQIDNLKEEHAIKIRKLKAEHIAKINNLNDKNYSFLVFTCILSLFAIFVQYCVNRYVYF